MGQFKETLYKNQPTLYKLIIFILATAAIVYFFPKRGKFKYEFSKGKPWQYENLYAPFDFAVLKSEETLKKEKQQISNNSIPYFDFNETVPKNIKQNLEKKFLNNFNELQPGAYRKKLYGFVYGIVSDIYITGVLEKSLEYAPQKLVYIKKVTK